ncbi:MAG TPA: response regulator [Kofleriaceae bacterium]|nr:response regulator [Kofleriaceae bacterium]
MTSPATGLLRVLLVEDNPGDADLIRDTLEASARPLDITVVGDGAAATDYLRQIADDPTYGHRRPDLVVLDLNLPRRDGRAVLTEIRRHPRLRPIPVVVLTSSDAERDIVGCYEAGASCYVTKPGDLATFQGVVRAIEAFWLNVAKLP